MTKTYTKEEQKKLLLTTLQEHSGKLLPIVKDTITKILDYKAKKWVDTVDSQTVENTLNIFDLIKKLKPEKKDTINKIIETALKKRFVYDEKSNWVFINKLNTNRSDFPIFIADLLEKSKKFNMRDIEMSIKKNDYSTIRKFLLEIEKHSEFIWGEFLDDPDKYTQNIRKNSEEGGIVERHVLNHYIENGWQIVHMGGNGDLIDMLLGIDFIVNKDGEYLCVQVKKIPSLGKVEIDNECYIEIKGDFELNGNDLIDIIAYATLDGKNIFVSKRQNYYYYKDKILKREFGLPIPSTTYNKRVLIKN